MTERAATSCPNCEALERKINELVERIAALEAELAKAKKNSSNSSKPPSSDITKPPKPQSSGKKKAKRKRGAQPGHPRHERKPFDESEIDYFFDHYYDICPAWNSSDRRPTGFLRQGRPKTSNGVLTNTVRVTFALSPRPAWTPPTTPPSRRSALWSSIAM